jgi:hypothetical protein
MAPVTQEDVGAKYPEPIRPGETLRGVCVDMRFTRQNKAHNRVLDMAVGAVAATGELLTRSIFEDNRNCGLFDTLEPGDVAEVQLVGDVAAVAASKGWKGMQKAPEAAPARGSWNGRGLAGPAPERPKYTPKEWKFTVWKSRSEPVPAWLDDNLLSIAKTTCGAEVKREKVRAGSPRRAADDAPKTDGPGIAE